MFTPVVTLLTLELGATTVAVIWVYCCCDGSEKGTGCAPRLMVVVPALLGRKLVVSSVSPPIKVTGLVVIEPIAMFPVLTTSIFGAPTPGLSCLLHRTT